MTKVDMVLVSGLEVEEEVIEENPEEMEGDEEKPTTPVWEFKYYFS